MHFYQKLNQCWEQTQSLLCVGLDPNIQTIPNRFLTSDTPFYDFCRFIIDQTAPSACAFKLQVAYYSSQAKEGELEDLIQYIKQYYPQHLVILDAKRNDMYESAEQYATEVFDRYQADAVTINPYMGLDTATPFLNRSGKGCIFLCKTSNPSAPTFQDLPIATQYNKPLYEVIADTIGNVWNENNCLLVMGATSPASMAHIRSNHPDVPFLVPGIGEQGGDLVEVLKAGLNRNGTGLLINVSRSILHADDPKLKAQEFHDVINSFRECA